MQCHQCEHNGKKSPACLICLDTINQQYNHGRVHIPIDPVNQRAVVQSSGACAYRHKSALDVAVPQPTETQESTIALDQCCEEAVRMLLAVFLSMRDSDRNLVCHLLNGGTITRWAKEHGVSKQAILKNHLVRIVKLHPELTILTRSTIVHRNVDAVAKITVSKENTTNPKGPTHASQVPQTQGA